MHCPLCGARDLRKHKRTGLRRCPRHGFVGPRPRLEAHRRGITLAQWASIHRLIVHVSGGEAGEVIDRLLTHFYRGHNARSSAAI
jgi:hypothetical protein